MKLDPFYLIIDDWAFFGTRLDLLSTFSLLHVIEALPHLCPALFQRLDLLGRDLIEELSHALDLGLEVGTFLREDLVGALLSRQRFRTIRLAMIGVALLEVVALHV